MRRFVRRCHLWLGLSLGLLLVMLGLTGSVLVFYVEIDRWQHPAQAAAGQAVPASYDRAILTLRERFPDKHGPWRLEVTGQPGAIPARYYNPPETAGRDFAPLMVWLSPDGSRVLRRDYWGDYAMTWIYDLHYRLQLGPRGGELVGYAGIALLALLLSGLWAWWPRGSWTKALRLRRQAPPVRTLRDWHKLSGLAGLPLLAVLTVTGVMLALPDETDAVLAPAFGPPPQLPQPLSRDGSGEQIAPSRAVAVAARAMPEARLAWIEVPALGNMAFRLRLQQPGEHSRRFPHSYVWIDQHDGDVLDRFDATRGSAATLIGSWAHPLHDGSAGGAVLRWLLFVAGLVPAVLFVTGLMRWRLRRLRP